MKQFIKYSIFFLIIAAVIFLLNNIYTVKKTEFVNAYGDSATIAGFYNEPENSLDVLVFGTSTVSIGVQPAVLWNQQHITAYNFSTEQQYSIAAYYLLMESLKYQHPDLVIINARWITTQYTTEMDSGSGLLHLSLDNMRLSEAKVRAAIDIASRSKTQNALDYIFPLYFYHSRTDLAKNDFDFSYSSKQHALKGSCINLNNGEISMDNSSMEEKASDSLPHDFSGISPAYVEKMIELCKTNGIHVLLLSLPLTGWDWSMHTAVQAFADTYGVSYLDMNTKEIIKEIQIDPEADFADEMHENIIGSYKTSSFIASYLASNFKFDHELSAGVSESFNESYKTYMYYYNKYKSIVALKNTGHLSSYLSSLACSDDYIVMISAKGEFSNSLTPSQKVYLHTLGLNTDFDANILVYSYIAMIDSGNVVFEECSPVMLEYRYDSEAADFTVVSAGPNVGNLSSIRVSDKEYSLNSRGLNIVVFSKKLGYVIDSVNFDTFAGTDSHRN